MGMHEYIWHFARDAPETILLPVHLAPDNREEGLAVDQDLDPVLLYYLIKLARLLYVFEVVGKAGTALVPHANADHLGCRALQEVSKALNGGRCLETHPKL